MDILKIALLAFIGIGVLTIVVTYVKRRCVVNFPRAYRDPNIGEYGLRGGEMPDLPLPEWVDWTEPKNEGKEGRR